MEMDISDHELLSSERVFDGRIIKVFLEDVRLPDGREAHWERVAHPGAVGIVPFVDDENILLVRQYRHPVRGVLLEIPAGKLEPGEPPGVTAQRELGEEVGMKAGELFKIAEFYNSPGYSDEYFHLYLAKSLTEERRQAEPDEFLEVEPVRLSAALDMVSTGDIKDAKSIIGLTLAFLIMSNEARPFGGTLRNEA
jgi:ADP-ribose pyrophosphatase